MRLGEGVPSWEREEDEDWEERRLMRGREGVSALGVLCPVEHEAMSCRHVSNI